MNVSSSVNLQPLEKSLRKQLESAVKDARDVVEAAAHAVCHQLSVGAAKADGHLSEDEKDLRRRLRIHGRHLGDVRKEDKTQELDRLVEEIGYEHWHRMLFARFLAENNLLMYPDPDQPIAITLEECEDLAADEGAKNGWELAAQYAAKMLPQIFRIDSPVFSITLPTENQQELEKILACLQTDVFRASDSLGWVYQFWQIRRKEKVIEQVASGGKVGERELPAATQDFTEPYMVSFLLDNSLGAWWASKRLTEQDLAKATSEQEIREKAALPGVPLEYLRFVRTPSANEAEGVENTGPWIPAAGTFDAWPESLSELKTLDPCCGSGHFLVAAFLMLTPMRMELENLSAQEAVDRVLSENLHGLEIDQRCVELAAFALALAAWRFPSVGGYRVLPDLNVACSGQSINSESDIWISLGGDDEGMVAALELLHRQFEDAPTLGSLINPSDSAESGSMFELDWNELRPRLGAALSAEKDESTFEVGIVARGVSKAASLLSDEYWLLFTNPPYLTRAKQNDQLKEFSTQYFRAGQADLATLFFRRFRDFLCEGGVHASVTPLNWVYLKSYEKFRQILLKNSRIRHIARIGSASKATASWDVLRTLAIVSKDVPCGTDSITGIEAPSGDDLGRAREVIERQLNILTLDDVAKIPDSRFMLDFATNNTPLLSEAAYSHHGLTTGDTPRMKFQFWEVHECGEIWFPIQGTVTTSSEYDGSETVLRWQNGGGAIETLLGARKDGTEAWGKRGVLVSQMGKLAVTTYVKCAFDNNTAAIVPFDDSHRAALWCFCSSCEYNTEVRKVDQKLSVTSATLSKVPFDLAHWQQVASEKYPHGLPEPYSDDPTQWIFHGHPASSTHALHVAVARLLGYRWPAELNAEMELATDASIWVERSSQLFNLADDDGIVCIPAVGTEQRAEDRLLNLLHRAYEEGRNQEQVFPNKLAEGNLDDPITLDLTRRDWQPSLPDSFNQWRDSILEEVGHRGKTLESWLRDKFFIQHCKLFHHRPFIWHIWDGLPDGFSALINYHKLDNKLLKTLIYTYLNDWIKKQKNSSEDGHEERLAAAEFLKTKLEKILEGESPHDIFVRWKPLEEQPIGWNPDLNDGVRVNIRPWMTVGDIKKKGAGILRGRPNCKWSKDRGKDVESAPWYHLGPEYGEKVAARINDHHLTLAEKKAAKKIAI